MAENESRDETQGGDAETGPPSKREDLGRPAEADAQQNKAPTEVGPVTEEKKRAREEFNLHEADLGRNPQG
jgi:hypothetical protein